MTFAPTPTGLEVPAETPQPPVTEQGTPQTPAAPVEGQPQVPPAEPGQQPAPATPEAPAAEQSPEQEAAQQAVEKAGLDVSAWQQEFDTTGDVSEEGRAQIAESPGLKELFGEQARAVVDQFIDGQKASAAHQQGELYAAGGGEQGYREMAAWAKGALTAQEIQQFDAAVTSGDHNAALFAIKGLRSRFENVNGREPQLIGGSQPASPAVAGFQSTAEMVTAMRDPRYANDPAYRKEVEQKTMRSNF
ncbi:capsid assembly protein [Castellaniella sp.]|uniref:capsid assembly protein n=1 Tax=Castellaniella sp. TaxID=1955812 RepID=UPI002AFEC61D|nr:hypothetical protein [Castellaniella sp.]